jgi:hypothetical protein
MKNPPVGMCTPPPKKNPTPRHTHAHSLTMMKNTLNTSGSSSVGSTRSSAVPPVMGFTPLEKNSFTAATRLGTPAAHSSSSWALGLKSTPKAVAPTTPMVRRPSSW